MLEFSDKPYDPIAPNPNRLLLRLAQQVNRTLTLKGERHRIQEVDLLNPAAVADVIDRSDRHVLFVANHSTHSDPPVMAEVHRQLGIASLFMAAYDVFLRNTFDAWVMRKTGAFSVDRDGCDKQAVNHAVEALVGGDYALTIFPEGNVHFMNDRVRPFMEGAAYIAMKAQKLLGLQKPVWVVPVAIKATYLGDVRPTVIREIEALAEASGVELPQAGLWSDRIKQFGMQLLKLRLSGLGLPTEHLDAGSVRENLEVSAGIIIGQLEEKLEQRVRPKDTLYDRIRKLRHTIHLIRLNPERDPDDRQTDVWADHAMLALRILNYTGDYLDGMPSLDRVAETCEKLMEDFTSESKPSFGDRKVYIQFAEPLSLSAHLEDFRKRPRGTSDEVTRAMEAGVQQGLDLINGQNPCEGGKPFEM